MFKVSREVVEYSPEACQFQVFVSCVGGIMNQHMLCATTWVLQREVHGLGIEWASVLCRHRGGLPLDGGLASLDSCRLHFVNIGDVSFEL